MRHIFPALARSEMIIVKIGIFPATLHAVVAILLFCLLPLQLDSQTPPRKTFKDDIVRKHKETKGSITSEELSSVGTRFSRWQQSNNVLAACPELKDLNGLNVEQILAYAALKERIDGMTVVWDETGSIPIYISAPVLESVLEYIAPGEGGYSKSTADGFFSTFGTLLRIRDPRTEFAAVQVSACEDERIHVKFQQYHEGIEVWGKEIILHFDARGNIDLFTGRYSPSADPETSSEFGLSAGEAITVVKNDLSRRTAIQKLDNPASVLLGYDGPESRRVMHVSNITRPARPAWKIEIRPNLVDRWRYFVDAENGGILRKYNATCTDGPSTANASDLNGKSQTIHTYDRQGTYYLIDASRPMYNASASVIPANPVGAITTLDAKNTDLVNNDHVTSPNNTWSDAAAVSAHNNAAVTYEYFLNSHSRNAIDNKGSTIISVVNATENNQPMENAYWNGKFMIYGNGGTYFKPLAGGLDVGAHEMTHGVTEHTAALEYQGQSGALNESFSDIFAAMVDRDDWKIGEDIIKSLQEFPSGTMRDMEDPHNGGSPGSNTWQPKHMNEYQNLPPNQDNGGVHVNSGIPNHVAYLLGTSIGRDKAEDIFYCALSTKLTKQSLFVDFRLAITKCAEEIYGVGSNEVTQCRNACDLVGISDGNPTKDPDDLPAVNGDDKMLFMSTDPADPIYLWIVTPPGATGDFSSLTATSVSRRPSISDDGSIAVFIDGDNNLRAIALDPATPNEQVIDDTQIWNTVAVSRNENLIALTTLLQESAIHLFDISGPSAVLKSFDIYTPNYSGGSVPNVAQFADAMDFSHDNEYLLFDTYNEITVGGDKIGFWDINLMDVWDEAGSTFGTGQNFRIFPQEPAVDIGNPTYAKNKTMVFAFDLQLPVLQKAFVMAVDLIRNHSIPVVEINYLEPGFPSYRGDDRLLSYERTPATGPFTGISVIFDIGLKEDAMTPDGQPKEFVGYGAYGVWFRQGSRVSTTVQDLALPDAGILLHQNFPNPFNPVTTIEYALPERTFVRLEIYDAMGRMLQVLVSADMAEGTHTAHWDGVDEFGRQVSSGMYYYRLTTENGSVSRRMLLQK